MPSPLLALALLAPQDDPTEPGALVPAGLLPGESAVPLEPAPPPDPAADPELAYCLLRVVDGESGRGVEGATVDVAEEEWHDPPDHEPLLATFETGPDGSVRLSWPADARPEKVRVRRRGYHPRTDALDSLRGTEVVLLRVDRDDDFRLRLVDLDGAPIAGGRVRSFYTCDHEPSAFVGISGEDGWIDLTGRPHPRWDGDAATSAPGYAPHDDEFDFQDFGWEVAHRGGAELWLGRRRSIDVRVLDVDGTAWTGGRVLRREDPYCVASLDAEGRGRWVSPDSVDDTGGQLLGERGFDGEWIAVPRAPRDRPLVLRRGDAEAPPDDVPTAACVVALSPSEASEGRYRPELELLHDDGWMEIVTGREEHDLPLGRWTVTIGSDFSGWRERTFGFELDAAGFVLEEEARPEPMLELSGLRTDELVRLTVQAGDASIARTGRRLRARFPVPADRPITVLARREDGGVRRLFVPPLERDTTVDWTDAEVVRPALPRVEEAPHVRRAFQVVDDEGRPLPDAEVDVVHAARVGDVAWVDADAATGVRSLETPAGVAWSLAARSEGHATAYLEGRGEPGRLETLRLARLATLRVEGAAVVLVAPHALDADAAARGVLLRPGRRHVEAVAPDGRRVRLELRLAPGESRTVRLPR